MLDELTELRQRIRGLSDEELWRMVNADSAQYRQLALDCAKSEINRRGLTLDKINVNAEAQAGGPYRAKWAEYRRRRNLFLIVWLTYAPGVVIIGMPLAWLLHSDVAAYVVAALWMVAFLAAGNYWASWKCPRCGEPFFHKWWYHNSFARKCVHCKLPKWAEDDYEA